MRYRPDIDGLRAIAVLLVVFFHGGFPLIPGGFVGVDIFFVISGFLITGIIYHELQDGTFSYLSFYTRRIKRICPALLLVLAICTIASFFVLIPEDLRTFGRSLASAVFFYANWHFYTQVGYFDGPAIEKPLLHTWSLAVEEQFYLVWPALFLFLFQFTRKALLPAAIAILLVCSLIASQLLLRTHPAQVFYLLPYRMWELLLGAFVATWGVPKLSLRAASALGAIGYCAIAYSALTYTATTPFPGFNALLPCGGAVLLIVAGEHERAFSRQILSSGAFRFFGLISYSLYLFHWPLFSFANLALGRHPGLETSLVIIAISIAASVLSWRFVEAPARRATLRFPILALRVATAAIILGGCGILFNASMGLPFRVPKEVRLASLASVGLGSKDCRSDPVPDIPGSRCAIGAPAKDLQYDFVVWGDFHANHLALAFADQAASRKLAGIVIAASGCGPFLDEARVPIGCPETTQKAAEWLKTQKGLKVIFLAGIWAVYADLGLLDTPRPKETMQGADGQASNAQRAGIGETLQLAKSLNAKVAIIQDIPSFPMKVASCSARARMFGRPDAHCFILPRPEHDRRSRRASRLLRDLSRSYGFGIVETTHAFCDEQACRAKMGDTILFRDDTHLNPAGSRYLGKYLQIPWSSEQAEVPSAASTQASAVSLP